MALELHEYTLIESQPRLARQLVVAIWKNSRPIDVVAKSCDDIPWEGDEHDAHANISR